VQCITHRPLCSFGQLLVLLAETTCTLRPETGHLPALAGHIASCSVEHSCAAVPSSFMIASNQFG
jgi:hypothetical protein